MGSHSRIEGPYKAEEWFHVEQEDAIKDRDPLAVRGHYYYYRRNVEKTGEPNAMDASAKGEDFVSPSRSGL